jgi:molybdopterin-guanine dinucleotide biosynthesis protein A
LQQRIMWQCKTRPLCGAPVIGAILAGGSGERLGLGSKAAVMLAGRPLVAYPAAALAEVCESVAIVCKPDTELPELPGVERWYEPAEPRHPLTGIVHALERSREPVLVCAADMPFVTADACRSLVTSPRAATAGDGPAAVVAIAGGVLQPTFGLYTSVALGGLRSADPNGSLTAAVEALGPARVALPPALVRSVNTPGDLAAAEAELGG